MSANSTCVIVAAVVLFATMGAASAAARGRHHYDVMRAPTDAIGAAPRVHQFYPEEVENGVRGNLPFNNQMRKFSDPLNANGAGG